MFTNNVHVVYCVCNNVHVVYTNNVHVVYCVYLSYNFKKSSTTNILLKKKEQKQTSF